MTKEEILEAVKSMSVIELSELVKSLEDEFGVSAAPVAVAAAPLVEKRPQKNKLTLPFIWTR